MKRPSKSSCRWQAGQALKPVSPFRTAHTCPPAVCRAAPSSKALSKLDGAVEIMEPRRLPEHLVKELVWNFVDRRQPEKPLAGLTTETSTTISPTTDWVSERPGVDSGRFWGRVWGIGEALTTPSANVAATVSPTVDLVKDLVTEHIEKVKVTMWQTTNLVTTGQIEEVASTLSKEQIVGNATGADKTSFTTTTTTTTIPTTTPTTRVVEVTKDYRVFGSEVTISIEDLHWSYYLLIGMLPTLIISS